jgi:hypothetical protein
MLVEEGAGLFRRVAFAARSLGKGAVEAGVDGFLVAEEPVVLGLEEVEGAVDELGGRGIGATVELALDAVFGGGVEDEAHGVSVPPKIGMEQRRAAP